MLGDGFNFFRALTAEVRNSTQVRFEFVYRNVEQIGITLAERIPQLESTADAGRRLKAKISVGILMKLPTKQLAVEPLRAREISLT